MKGRSISAFLIVSLLCLLLAVSPARAATYQTLVLSNEGANGLVSQLVAAGYGNENLYQTLVDMVGNTRPSVGSVITPAFLSLLRSQPVSSAVLTTQINSYSIPGQALAISSDGTVQVLSIFGASYQGVSGASTLVSDISGVGAAKFLFPTASGGTITSFTSGGNTYNVIGIGFSGEQAYVLSNEGGGLISQIVAAGYGNLSPYQMLIQMRNEANPSISGIIPDALIQTLRNLSASSAVHTTQMKNLTGTFAVSTDGTVQAVSISGATYNGAPGSSTLASNLSGIGNANFVYPTSPGTPLTSFTSGGTAYNVFVIAYMPGTAPAATPAPPSLWLAITGCLALAGYALWSRRRAVWLPLVLLGVFGLASPVRAATYQTFVFSNEGVNGLASRVVAAGYGNDNLYQALLDIVSSANPTVSGIITPTFLSALRSQPASSTVFTTQLQSVSVAGQAIAISTDGTFQMVSIFGAAYQNTFSNTVLRSNVTGVGTAKFVSNPGGTIASFNANGNTYNVVGIAFSGEQTFILSNEGAGLISQLVTAGYGNFALWQALVTINNNANPSDAGILTPAFATTLKNSPLSSGVITTLMKNINGAGQAYAISTDGTVQTVSIFGAAYQGQSGAATQVSDISGVGNANFVYSANAGLPLTSFTSGGTTYNVFAIAYAPGTAPSATPVPPSLWLAITGCLALAGYALRTRCPAK